jgi:hypothetical protein
LWFFGRMMRLKGKSQYVSLTKCPRKKGGEREKGHFDLDYFTCRLRLDDRMQAEVKQLV